jgi:putative phage-type endonuclease
MNVSPYCTYYQKWEEKVYDKKKGDNAAMKYGRETESISRNEFEDRMGIKVPASNVENVKFPWLHASLDGIDESGTIVVEIKKANKTDHATAINGKVPLKYVPQCQHILNTMGLDGMYYFSSPADGSKGVIVEVARDSSYIDASLFPEEQKFWDRVVNHLPPELSAEDPVDLEDTRECKKKVKRLLEIREMIKPLEKEDDEIMEYLKLNSQGRSAKGHGIVLQKQICMGAIDYSRVPNLEGIDLSPYRKKSFEKWTVRAI